MDLLLVAASKCEGLEPIVRIVKNLFDMLRIIVPIALIIFGALDLAKAVIASDEKEIKGATTKFIKRAIAAVAVFFAVTLVDVIMGLIGTDVNSKEISGVGSANWFDCWKSVKN